MAEFKLGRIRFVWKNNWSTGTVYYKDDVVALGGKMYICVIGHTASADFFTDFDISPPKWNLVSDGFTWQGSWQTGTRYIYNDIVEYGARLYICNTVHTSADDSTSGLEADQEKWTIFAEGLDWRSDWTPATRYIVNDLVKYGGQTYVCITPHTSAATDALGLEQDQEKWQVFNAGTEYKSTWTESTRYKVNDVVRYGAVLWICTTQHTSTSVFANDVSNWEQYVRGFQFEGQWDPYATYQPGDVVRYGGNQYIAKTNHTEKNPSVELTDWDLFVEGINFKGAWGEDSSGQDYRVGDVITHGAYTYICIADNNNQEPPNPTYWQQLTAGMQWRGDWLDDQEYFLGDVVRYDGNSYICILGHISEGDDGSSLGGAANSRPDQDTAGTYWNIIAASSELSVLTTQGDLAYYTGAAPARLPIGENGQVLTVGSTGIPEWAYLGDADDVYYVAEHGVDSPAPEYGRTIDRPWASIRYAAEQVELGTKRPQAKRLLELNRLFIAREIVEWTEWQIANAAVGSIWENFDYESTKCERDMGFIVDALIWDITHGGNVRSREAALEYVNNASNFYTLDQDGQTVAAINYGLTLIGNVLAQTAPDNNYQTLNGDNSTAIIAQYTDATLTAESGVLAEITGLVGIITDAITAGVATNIPDRLIRNTLIEVSTGKYYEVLPIIVPAECCIIGDELRSTNVQPRKKSNGTLTAKSDYNFTYAGLSRVEAIIGDIIDGSTVTPTTGNNEVQSQLFPYGDAPQAAAATTLMRSIKRKIDHGIKTKTEASLVGLADIHDVNYGYARNQILANKDFVAGEIIGYIADQYPDIKYSKTKCKQDVGYIIDAIAYDLSYDSNWQSVNAGLAYFNGTSGVLQIDSTEKTATLAAYAYMKSILQTISQNLVVTPVLNTDNLTQTRGTPGNVTASNAIGSLIDDITTIINSGPGSAPSVTYPDISGASAGLQSDFAALNSAKADVQTAVIDFINTNFGTFNYDGAKCRRDAGILQTDAAYDISLGTNFNSIRNGLAYRRGMSAKVIASQLTQTIGAITKQKDEVEALLSDGTGISRNTAYWNEVIDIVANGASAADSITWSDPGVTAKTTARTELQSNRASIISDLTSWINSTYPGLAYNEATCERDTGYIIDALSYDIQYGGNSATYEAARAYYDGAVQVLPVAQRTETAAAFTQLKTIVTTYMSGTTEETEAGGLLDIIINVISTGLGTLPTKTYPDYTWAAAGVEADADTILADTTVVPAVLQYITDTYSGFVYDHAKCSRDLGLIIDAARYDFCLGTNFATMVAAYSYLREPSSKVVGDQKAATIAANEYARTLFRAEASEAVAIAGVDDTFEFVNDMIFSGSNEGSIRGVDDHRSYAAVRQIELNKDFIVAEVHAYVADYFKSTVSGINGTTNVFTADSTAWMKPWMPIKFVSPDDSSNSVEDAGYSETTVYYVRDILSSTTFTVAESIGGDAVDAEDHEASFDVTIGYDYNIALCSRDVTAYLDAMKWDLTYPQEFVRTYTDGVSVTLPAWYKSGLAARYYVNSVLGSQEEDFFYLRNGTGLRLMTMEGLSGDLTPANAYGTSRVTAGAYASLDPGWGPNDTRVWITARSPYVQNCTTFGNAATGQRIDGALHNGGNDSMVSNDFTQVISDGIGAHILNNGRAELVSVFTYYSHIGYLAETGGRIRATNGNNSYGNFGSVAEGVDPDEIPVTAVVDNVTQYRATISAVNTDQSEILNVEFGHAGNDYTEANITFFGPGDNEDVISDEFRDDAVFQVRLLDLDDSSGDIGGDGYTIVSNAAQDGTTTGITLSATDSASATAYIGMKVIVTAGNGVGNYAIVDTYNSGTKEATVVRESDGVAGWDHLIPGTTIVAPDSTSTYQIEPAISFSAPPSSSAAHTLPSNTWNDIHWFETSELFTGISGTASADGINATFDVERVYSKYFVTLNTAGTGYTRFETVTIPGTSLGGATPANDLVITLTTVNSVTGAVVDFDFDGNARGGKFIAVGAGTQGAYSWDGETWTSSTMPSPGAGANWQRIADGLVDDGSSTYRASYAVAVANSNNVAYTDDGVNWSSTTFPVAMSSTGNKYIEYALLGPGVGRFVVINDNDTDVVYSDDGGANWTHVSGALPGTGYKHLTRGKGVFVAVDTSGNAVYSADGITWAAGAGLPSLTYTDIAYGANKFIAVASNNNQGAYSLDGRNWTVLTLPAIASPTVYTRIEYGQGVFVATQTSTGSTVIKSEDGIYWQQVNVAADPGTPSGHGAIAFGNPARAGMFALTSAGASKTHAVKYRQGCRARGRPSIASEKIFEIRMLEPGSGYYSGAPTMTVTDPNNIYDINFTVRVGKGALANPSFANRGTGFTQATGDIDQIGSDGYADFLQDGSYVAVRRLTERPVPGSNVVFGNLPDDVFKLVNVVTFRGTNDGSYTAFLQLSPDMPNESAPSDGEDVTMRIRYSQVRLTGHDFLDVGTGGFTDSNYPGEPLIEPDQSTETRDSNGGRVFYTSTDQDGNFRVGDLFTIEQATGVATLNAEAFNIAGLQELTLGQVTLGGNSARITEFSTDPFFTANSDTVVPTQRAVKAYIESQIGGGGASLTVNSVTAGDIFIGTNVIQNVAGGVINIQANVNFTGGIIGIPVAYNYFLR